MSEKIEQEQPTEAGNGASRMVPTAEVRQSSIEETRRDSSSGGSHAYRDFLVGRLGHNNPGKVDEYLNDEDR